MLGKLFFCESLAVLIVLWVPTLQYRIVKR